MLTIITGDNPLTANIIIDSKITLWIYIHKFINTSRKQYILINNKLNFKTGNTEDNPIIFN